KEAILLMRRALESSRGDPRVYVLLVEAYHRAGDYSGAVGAASEAVQRLPESARMSYLLGVPLQDVGRWQASRQYFEKTVSLDPNCAEAYVALAELARRDGKSENAVQYLRKALTVRPDYTDALVQLGKNYMDVSRLEDARQALPEAAVQAPGDPSPHLMLSQIYSARKEFDKSASERRIFQDLKKKSSADAASPEPTMSSKL